MAYQGRTVALYAVGSCGRDEDSTWWSTGGQWSTRVHMHVGAGCGCNGDDWADGLQRRAQDLTAKTAAHGGAAVRQKLMQ
jgi:hypothetical protein